MCEQHNSLTDRACGGCGAAVRSHRPRPSALADDVHVSATLQAGGSGEPASASVVSSAEAYTATLVTDDGELVVIGQAASPPVSSAAQRMAELLAEPALAPIRAAAPALAPLTPVRAAEALADMDLPIDLSFAPRSESELSSASSPIPSQFIPSQPSRQGPPVMQSQPMHAPDNHGMHQFCLKGEGLDAPFLEPFVAYTVIVYSEQSNASLLQVQCVEHRIAPDLQSRTNLLVDAGGC